jgi:hypothetical protein
MKVPDRDEIILGIVYDYLVRDCRINLPLPRTSGYATTCGRDEFVLRCLELIDAHETCCCGDRMADHHVGGSCSSPKSQLDWYEECLRKPAVGPAVADEGDPS